MAAEPGDFAERAGRGLFMDRVVVFVRYQLVERPDFHLREGDAGLGTRDGAIDQGHPKHPKAQDAENRDQLHQALCGSEPRLFGPAAQFQNLMENLGFYILTITDAHQVDKGGWARELRARLIPA